MSLTVGTAKLVYKYGVTANIVMPRARTRLTLQGPGGATFQKPDDGFDKFDPANSTPLFAYLCSEEAARITAQAFIVWGKEVKILKRQEMEASFQSDAVWNLDSLHEVLGPYYEKKQPIADALSVIPG